MMYSFEGNFKRRPEQNLAGASRKETRDVLLKRAHQERQKREEHRRKLKSTILIQSWIRSFIVRQNVKQQQRLCFDEMEQFCDNGVLVKQLLKRILFFYNPRVDSDRLLKTCNRLIQYKNVILKLFDHDIDEVWLVRRFLALCLRQIIKRESMDICVKCIDLFTQNTDSREKIETWPYLVKKGYFKRLRVLLESKQYTDIVLDLINRPLQILNLITTQKGSEIIISEFLKYFFYPSVTPMIKSTLIPYLKSKKFPYDSILQYLHEELPPRNENNNLLFCLLSLEPSNFEQSTESLQVYAKLTYNLYKLLTVFDLTESDSESENMDVNEEPLTSIDYLQLLNNHERVKKILNYFDQNSSDELVLISLMNICHNLLLIYQDSIHKYMLVYMLALRGTFLKKLWNFIQETKTNETLSQHYNGSLLEWTVSHTATAVFCSMFKLYNATLHDTDAVNNYGIFTLDDLSSMAEILKHISLDLIDIAFPMCRPNLISTTPEMLHLYKSCLTALSLVHILDLRKHFCKEEFWTKKKIPISQDLSKRNYLAKTLKPFYGIVNNEEEEEYLPPLSTIEQRSLAVLQKAPFLLEFNTRVLILRELCRAAITAATHGLGFHQRDFIAGNAVVIRRTHLYEDAFEKLSIQNEPDLKHKLRIQFINTAGIDEPGIDGGGIFKEFINEVLKTAFDPNRGFFLLTNDNLLYPNPNVHLITPDFNKHYFFIGRLVGKALFENVLVDLPLADFFLEKLLVDKIDAHHLQSLDPVLYRNLLYLRDYPGNVQDLGLDFTIASNDLGETRVINLKPNGNNIAVTNYNRLEYIHLLADYKLNKQIKKQCQAFREGIDSVVPLLWLKLFNYNELLILIGGDTQELDLNDLRNHTAYGGEFEAEHPTILIFWNILESFSDTQRKQLLKFVTSCSRAPLLGFKELTPSFCIQSAGSEDRMPTASTCLNLLKLPVIKQESILRNKLLQAIEQQAGFELS